MGNLAAKLLAFNNNYFLTQLETCEVLLDCLCRGSLGSYVAICCLPHQPQTFSPPVFRLLNSLLCSSQLSLLLFFSDHFSSLLPFPLMYAKGPQSSVMKVVHLLCCASQNVLKFTGLCTEAKGFSGERGNGANRTVFYSEISMLLIMFLLVHSYYLTRNEW